MYCDLKSFLRDLYEGDIIPWSKFMIKNLIIWDKIMSELDYKGVIYCYLVK